jgi:CubicO group peptidase (beta-lactamase class C family)
MSGICKTAIATGLFACFAQPGRADAIDDYAARQMRQLRLPGLALAIVRDGKAETIRTYGKASLELDVPVTPDTVFELGSLTKQFTASAVMMLVEDGKLRLDDSIATHLPKVPDEWRGITIRHLLTHSSGLREYLGIPGLADEAHALGHREMTALFAARIAQEFPPGDTWAYSNTGYLLLGDIIERASSQSYWEFLRARIFLPAGMQATRSSEPRAVIRNRAKGYGWNGRGFESRPALSENAYSAGSITSTIADMASWAIALHEGRLISAASRDRIWTPLTVSRSPVPPFSYGFGWVLDRERGHRAVFHSGGTPGFSSAIRYYPDHRLAVIVLANHGDRILDQMPLEIAGLILPDVARIDGQDPDAGRSAKLADTLRAFVAGKADPRDFTPAMQLFLTTATARGLGEWIGSHGELKALRYAQTERDGGLSILRYRATVGDAELWFSFTLTATNEIARIAWW